MYKNGFASIRIKFVQASILLQGFEILIKSNLVKKPVLAVRRISLPFDNNYCLVKIV